MSASTFSTSRLISSKLSRTTVLVRLSLMTIPVYDISFERETGLEPATSSLARRRSSQLSYSRAYTCIIHPIWRFCEGSFVYLIF